MNNAMLLTDGYKLDHRRQYPNGTEYVYSTWIPRSNKYMPGAPGAVVFGLQYLIKEYLIKYFKEHFFDRPKEEVVNEFQNFIDSYLGPNSIGTDHIAELHDLGYLPIIIKALPEGTICPIGVPAFTVRNTKPKFFWLTNFLETIISNVIWMPMTSATSAYLYKKELVRHSKKTGFYSEENIQFLCHDFSMRGMAGLEASIISGMAHMLSFTGSETLPAIEAVKEYYGCKGLIAGTVPATEHSVMCAGGIDDELGTFKRLINDIYPTGFVSIVSDTWDFWKVMTEFLPALKDDIMKREGRVVIRPDSGDPVDIICGLDYIIIVKEDYSDDEEINEVIADSIMERFYYPDGDEDCVSVDYTGYFKIDDKFYKVTLSDVKWKYDIGVMIPKYDPNNIDMVEIPAAVCLGAYETLYNIFGGCINEVGYKVLDTHIGLLYGDSITLERQREIYRRLENKGFAATNLVLGVGSYTYQYKSRDTLGFAMKATFCVIDGQPKPIFKDPKTDDGTKKSLKGLCKVVKDPEGNILVIDQCGNDDDGLLETVFEDGKLVKEFTFDEIRENLCKF